MPTPTSPAAPTEAEIVELAEIMLVSYDDALTVIAADSLLAVSNAKWAKALEYIEAWPGIRDEANDIKRVGSIEFFENTAADYRLHFRNVLRALYGLAPLYSETDATLPTVASLEWF